MINDIYVINLKGHVVTPTKSKFYRRLVDHIFKRRIKYEEMTFIVKWIIPVAT